MSTTHCLPIWATMMLCVSVNTHQTIINWLLLQPAVPSITRLQPTLQGSLPVNRVILVFLVRTMPFYDHPQTEQPSCRQEMPLLGSTSMIFPHQMTGDLYLQDHVIIDDVDGQNIGRVVFRIGVVSLVNWGFSVACIQWGTVLAQIPAGRNEKVIWRYRNAATNNRVLMTDGGIAPASIVPGVVLPPHPPALFVAHGIVVQGKLIPWHRRSVMEIQNPPSAIFYHQHERRGSQHLQLVPPKFLPNGKSYQFNRLTFSTQVQQFRRGD